MSRQISCFIIGDVNIDYITDLSHVVISGESNPCFHNPVIASVGGNAVFFAEAGCEAEFDNITVLCSVGNDVAGARALEHLQGLGVKVHQMPSNQQTGQVLIIYQPDDRRIMVADRGANKDFHIPQSDMLSEIATECDLLYISGYMLLDNEQCAAIHTIARAFQAEGAKVLVDIVPHDVWQTRSWQEYVNMCSCADFVAAELSTISSFHNNLPDELSPEKVASLLLKEFEFCLVRINDVSDFIIADRVQQKTISIPYSRETSSLRFTDRVIAHAMYQYLIDSKLLFDSEAWIARATKVVTPVFEKDVSV